MQFHPSCDPQLLWSAGGDVRLDACTVANFLSYLSNKILQMDNLKFVYRLAIFYEFFLNVDLK